jgi:hypothetical protein
MIDIHSYRHGIMRLGRLSSLLLAAAALSAVGAAGCGDRTPPPLGDHDASGDAPQLGDVVIAPCSTPAAGCPCTVVGEQDVCGTVYHYSGSYITCSKEYITCQDDGTWSACVGPTVLGAD